MEEGSYTGFAHLSVNDDKQSEATHKSHGRKDSGVICIKLRR